MSALKPQAKSWSRFEQSHNYHQIFVKNSTNAVMSLNFGHNITKV